MFKKSQAALEFLTTYAWAFLVILIMIGALAYFGVLNPSALLPERCSLGSELECRDFKLDATNGAVVIKLVNSVGESISITKIETKSEGTTKLDCPTVTAETATGPIALPYTVSQGNQGDFTLAGCELTLWADAGFTVGQKGKVDITVTYNTVRSGANFPHQIKGDIFATVQ